MFLERSVPDMSTILSAPRSSKEKKKCSKHTSCVHGFVGLETHVADVTTKTAVVNLVS